MPCEIEHTDDYDDFELKLNAWFHTNNLDKLEIFWFPPLLSYVLYLYEYVFSLFIKRFDLFIIFLYICSFWIWVYFYWSHYYLRQRYVLRVNFVYTKWMILLHFSQTRFIIMYYFILFYLAFVIFISSNDGSMTFTWLQISHHNLV